MRVIFLAVALPLWMTSAQSADAQSITVANMFQRTCWTYVVDGGPDTAIANARALGLSVVQQDSVVMSEGVDASGHGYRISMEFWRGDYSCYLRGPASISRAALEGAVNSLARGWSSETGAEGRSWTSPDELYWANVTQEADGQFYVSLRSNYDQGY